jgi:hypothetical protein
MSVIYGWALIALGCWAGFTTSRTLASRGGWREHRALVLVGVLFVASCFLPGVAMLATAFRPWMLVPLGLCYVVLVPLPCYFKWANHGRVRVGRAVLFLVVAAALVAAGLELLPLAWFGL